MLRDLRRDRLTTCRPRGYVGSKQGEPAPVAVRSFFLASDPLGGRAGGLTDRPKPTKLIPQPPETLCNSPSITQTVKRVSPVNTGVIAVSYGPLMGCSGAHSNPGG
jgi:hypothetical protein